MWKHYCQVEHCELEVGDGELVIGAIRLHQAKTVKYQKCLTKLKVTK